MMTVYVKKRPGLLLYAPTVFDLMYNDINFEDDFIKQMVKDVDQTEHIMGQVFNSPIFGAIAPTRLSGGVKSLIVVYTLEEAKNYSSVLFGGNCVEWLRQISFKKDFTIWMQHALEFISGGEPTAVLQDREINAQTEDGIPLKTCEEVWNYYVAES